ncbi:hypothetical protein EV356DRAFT_108916 [Viridothelium virens]|uniref:Uncharacterized protein n=1 Tax=Viridothelium virens TaxID=1048519 RepID=A0A6A6HNZ7_VIRVR|nr:hypothetical protein EV356DRAFT_108916 [Viridothelium virens]
MRTLLRGSSNPDQSARIIGAKMRRPLGPTNSKSSWENPGSSPSTRLILKEILHFEVLSRTTAKSRFFGNVLATSNLLPASVYMIRLQALAYMLHVPFNVLILAIRRLVPSRFTKLKRAL